MTPPYDEVRPTRRPRPEPDPTRVVVVGAGIAGLAAAAAVRRDAPDVEVVVLESSDRVGGKLRLEEVGGLTVDVGAEAMLNRRPEAVDLARAAGLDDDLTYPATTSAHVWSRGRMRRMPRSLMGVPVDAKDLADSGLISRHGLARVAMDAVLPPTTLGDQDVSVGWLIEERFGREVVDRLVEPMLGGVYAGHARELSARAAVPQVVGLLEKDRSLMKAAGTVTASRTDTDVPVFAGIVGGVGRLPQAVAEGLDVRLRTTVRGLARSAEGRWTLLLGSAAEPELLAADAVVLAAPATASAKILGDVAPEAALELARIEYASMAIVTLAFPARQFPEVDGSGFLVPPVDKHTVKGATYSFSKWPWVREHGGDLVLMRTSIGRHREEQVLQAPDEEVVRLAVDDLSAAIGLSVPPVDAHVMRWGGALPQYAVGHLERVARIRQEVARRPGLGICGAAFDGLGIPACIASAEKAVAQVLPAVVGPDRRG